MAASVAWHGVSGDCCQSAAHSKKVLVEQLSDVGVSRAFSAGLFCKVTDVTTDLHLAAAEGRQLA